MHDPRMTGVDGFLAHARRTPNAVAVIAERPVTYGELAGRAQALATELLTQGLQPEQTVGVLLPRGADLVAALLGIWWAGGAYVPIDADEPLGRGARLLRAAGCRMVIAEASLTQRLRDAARTNACELGEINWIDPNTVGTPTDESAVPACAPGGARLAYVLFTSGSTGEPKGVEVEHAQVINLLHAAAALIGFSPQDRYLAVASIGFDISVAEVFVPLISGASLLLRERSLLLRPDRLAEEMRHHHVTVMQTGPSVWAVLLAGTTALPRLRVAISTAEPVAPELASRIAALADQAWNLYGPTETTVWATGHRMLADDPGGSSISAPIGTPLSGLSALVMDAQGQPVADGVQGELCLAGAGVARGYRDQPALTAERFTALGPLGERHYRTGDLVARRPDGVIEYFGRLDDQIKVRGVRIEPREVESALLRLPRVSQAAATWMPTASGGRVVVAALIGHWSSPPLSKDLQAGLREALPAAMIPARFVFPEHLPHSASGKVDRNAIRQLALAAADAGDTAADASGPMTPTEIELATIWKRVLRIDRVGIEENFFSVGGDSLASVQMSLEVETVFGVALPAHLAFETPTLRELALRIDQAAVPRQGSENTRHVFPFAPAGVGAPIFFCGIDHRMARPGLWTLPMPLQALSLWALGGGFIQADTLSELARAFVREIRTVQPDGPYRVAGYSLGGLIAFEIAQQLRASAQTVELLFMLDPLQPLRARLDSDAAPGGQPVAANQPLQARLQRVIRRIRARPSDLGAYLALKARWLVEEIALVQWLSYRLVDFYGRRPGRVSRALLPRNRWPAFGYAARKMIRHHVAQPYDGAAIVVLRQADRQHSIWPALLASDARVEFLDIEHIEMFDDPARRNWLQWLEEALAANRGSGH